MFDEDAGFSKIIRLEPEFEMTGEPRVRYVDKRDTRLVKYADDRALDFIRNVDPMPGHTLVLVLAMSASEYYGPNRNGDGFAEHPVSIPGLNGGQPVLDRTETLPQHHGSFETTAHNFMHHVNKDPAKAVGRVMKSFYNDPMHRVELLLAVNNKKAPSIVQRIQDHEYPGVSMGCRIRYDICSICGNRAPTRKQYCRHVNGQDPQYGMNKLLPDGRQCYVWNPSPVLFDISWVFRPADRIGYMMKKVANHGMQDARPYEISSAYLGEVVKDAEDKLSALHKMSIIDKYVQGDVKALDHDTSSCRCEPHEMSSIKQVADKLVPGFEDSFCPLPRELLEKATQYPLKDLFSSLSPLGIHPNVKEIHFVLSRKAGREPHPLIERMLPHIQSLLLEAFKDVPNWLDDITPHVAPDEQCIQPDLVEAALPCIEKRALYKEHLLRKYVPESYGGIMAPLMGADAERTYYTRAQQPLDIQDKTTGRQYQTTLSAAEETDWENKKRDLLEAGILASAGGLGYTALHALGKAKKIGPAAALLKLPALAMGGLGAAQVLGSGIPTAQSSTGVAVPINAPMVEKRSSSPLKTLSSLKHMASDSLMGPLAGGGLATMLLASDQFSPASTPKEFRQVAKEHPLLTTIGSTAGLLALRNLMKQSLGGIKVGHVHAQEDGVGLASIDTATLIKDIAAAWSDLF